VERCLPPVESADFPSGGSLVCSRTKSTSGYDIIDGAETVFWFGRSVISLVSLASSGLCRTETV
jgi:hypothetical protein